MGLFQHVLVFIRDLYLVHPALYLSTLDAGILILMEQVSLMMFSMNMVDSPMSFLLPSSWNFKMFLLLLQHFSVSPRPLGFGFGTKGFGVKGFGPGLDNY